MPDKYFIAVTVRLYDDRRKHTVFLNACHHIIKSFASVKFKLVVVIGVQFLTRYLLYGGLYSGSRQHCSQIKCRLVHFLPSNSFIRCFSSMFSISDFISRDLMFLIVTSARTMVSANFISVSLYRR